MYSKLLSAALVIALIFTGCSDHGQDAFPQAGNYFPTTPGSYWKFETVSECTEMNSDHCPKFSELWGGGDEHFADEDYNPISGKVGTAFFVKVVNNEYFMTGYYQPEFKFMDDKLWVNQSWITSANNDFLHEEFTVKEVNAVKNLRRKIFSDVIVIERNYLEKTWQGNLNPLSKTITYYAKGIGQIYRDHTDYTSDNEFKEYLVEYKIASK